MMQIFRKPTASIFLLITSCIFFLLRLPSLFEPNWYGDEGIYQAIGYSMRQGLLLYADVWDNKPPLLYVLYSLFEGELFPIRALSLLFGIAALIAFFLLANNLFKKPLAVYLSTAIFSFLFAIPMFEGNIANAENFMLLPIIVGAYLVSKHLHKEQVRIQPKILLLSGMCLGIALLFKIVAIFDTLAFSLFLILSILPSTHHKFTFASLIKKPTLVSIVNLLTPFYGGVLVPVAVASLYFLIKGTFIDFIQAVFTTNIGYVAVENQLFFPQGLLAGKSILLGIVLAAILYYRHKLTTTQQFIFIWLAFSLFNAFFSHRPYTHYILVLLPSFSLLLGLLPILKTRSRNLVAILIVLITILVLQSFWYTRPQKVISYYQTFISYVMGDIDTRGYQASFDSRTPLTYDVATYLKSRVKENEKIFLWGDSAQIYQMTKTLPVSKFTVAYHMLNSEANLTHALDKLEQQSPRYIILFKDQQILPYSLQRYKVKAIIDGATIYERSN